VPVAYVTPAADATRRAVADALAGLDGVSVETVVNDGSVVVSVTVREADREAAERYTLRSSLRTVNS
jgi:nitrate reductase NapAB chaperone NapD